MKTQALNNITRTKQWWSASERQGSEIEVKIFGAYYLVELTTFPTGVWPETERLKQEDHRYQTTDKDHTIQMEISSLL